MLYKSVANISQNIDNIPSYLKDDIMALLQQVSRYMLRPLSVLNGKIVNVSASPKQSSAFYWNVLNKGVLIYESH